ncbi:Fungal chitin synthase [Macrophomina phaseolina MS6]|uniref:Fungal chitin synthase n=1 Tax=Macrophomina phaseolina (strain MS6) TaxID=1126212 RepID=K2T112_MACPH|nr:Fungal chitin synthase [Macrophomina phaseolina MS6]
MAFSFPGTSAKPPPPSWFTLIFNSLCCLAVALIVPFYGFRSFTNWPVTIEAIFSCALSEWNRQKGLRRLKAVQKEDSQIDPEKGGSRAKFMASVVGYREEAGLFQRCLESYKPSGVDTFLIGIDGNGPQDMEMVRVVERVYPAAVVVAIDEPLANMVLRSAEAHAFGSSYKPKALNERLDNLKQLPDEMLAEAKDMAMRLIFHKAKAILQRYGLLERPQNESGTRVICFHQPHGCKKDIMFTNFVMSMILRGASHNELEFLWTSDSDTLVMPDTLQKAAASMKLDSRIGGSCVTLGVHNSDENWLTKLGAAVYWSEMAITRSQNGAADAIDCQPGPCAAFRLSALEGILFDWYIQTSLGVRTVNQPTPSVKQEDHADNTQVVNEDRHLTTLLLLQNYKVTFLPFALALTDTPTTVVRWILQQLRWARAAHIERWQYPKVYAIHGAIPFLNAMIRHYGAPNPPTLRSRRTH